MAKVPNGVETLPKYQQPEQGARTLQTTDDRRTQDDIEREREFTFAKNVGPKDGSNFETPK